jgi:hypothetical protein
MKSRVNYWRETRKFLIIVKISHEIENQIYGFSQFTPINYIIRIIRKKQEVLTKNPQSEGFFHTAGKKTRTWK